jgi:uncharacterized protein DUF5677
MVDEHQSQYVKGLEAYKKSVGKALGFHARIRNLPLQGVSPTARLMFARIFFMSASILRLCPKVGEEKGIWDFTSIAILARSLFEAIMFFRYFCEPADADEWVARMMLMHLHDRCERVRLFTEMGKTEDVIGFTGEAEELRRLLRKNGFFQKLDEPKQKMLLNGYNPAFINLRTMGDKYSTSEHTWATYQFLSNYAHSHPVGFMRNSDERRDGLPNEPDKMYIPGVLYWLSTLLDEATKAFRRIPAGIATERFDAGN